MDHETLIVCVYKAVISYIKSTVCVAELHRAGLEPGDTEQVIHHLHRELLEAQELANTGKQKCLELQGNLKVSSHV